MERRAANLAMLLAFVSAFLVFRVSPVKQVWDSRYTLLLSESLYKHRSFDLSRYVAGTETQPVWPYQLQRAGTSVYYSYPPGTSILSIPLVAVMNAGGLSSIGRDGRYDAKADATMQRWIASLVCAGTVTLLLRLALIYLPLRKAVALAVVAGLATPLWSTASRALWSQTWETFLLSAAMLMVALAAPRRRLLFVLAVGTLLGWMYMTRPASAISIVALLGWLTARAPWRGVGAGAVALLWLGVFAAWSHAHYGTLQPPYYSGSFSLAGAGVGAAGVLVSPSRGLLVFCPWLLAVAVAVGARVRILAHSPAAWASAGAIVAQWVMASAWPMWWMGHCFGPRAFLDVVPWMILLAALAWKALGQADAAWGLGPGPRWIAAALVVAGVLIHAAGACSKACSEWNQSPISVDAAPERVWAWSDPQFLAPLMASRRAGAAPRGAD